MHDVLCEYFGRKIEKCVNKTCVCKWSPVTILPTVRKAGVTTKGEGCLNYKQLISINTGETYIEYNALYN